MVFILSCLSFSPPSLLLLCYRIVYHQDKSVAIFQYSAELLLNYNILLNYQYNEGGNLFSEY